MHVTVARIFAGGQNNSGDSWQRLPGAERCQQLHAIDISDKAWPW